MTPDPIALLEALERRSLARAQGLPLKVEVKPTWTGIGFRLGDNALVTSLEEIKEILPYPGLTRIPEAPAWIKGIANIRGNLLPVMDLRAHLKGEETPITSRCKVVVTSHKEVTAGFLVDEVLGLQHFLLEEQAGNAVILDPALRPYIIGAFQREKLLWGVFSFQKVIVHPAFLEVA
ncbi:MAG: purine-binding chemotaxis protein CheW [Gammaproteobacteria bacterium]|nr:MAG: purine-binding chemotaxis protein CheW [Gammaproteobacteria bacterium]